MHANPPPVGTGTHVSHSLIVLSCAKGKRRTKTTDEPINVWGSITPVSNAGGCFLSPRYSSSQPMHLSSTPAAAAASFSTTEINRFGQSRFRSAVYASRESVDGR